MLLLGVPGPQLMELVTLHACAQPGAEVEAQLYRSLLYDRGSFFVVS